MRKLDLKGQNFGRLMVLNETVKPSNLKIRKIKTAYWLCKCACGNEKIATTHNLRSGDTKSCGCLVSEISSKNAKYGHSANYLGELAISRKIYRSYKDNATKRKLIWNLSYDKFSVLASLNCAYCGTIPSSKRSIKLKEFKSSEFIYNGIDRIDNLQGYEPQNCISCCKWCNIAKGTRTYSEFLTWIENVYHNLKEVNNEIVAR